MLLHFIKLHWRAVLAIALLAFASGPGYLRG